MSNGTPLTDFAAVVFDFDGLIVDTETPLYQAWAETFRHYGAEPIELDMWAQSLGRHDDDPLMLDPLDELRRRTSVDIDADEVQTVRRARRDALLSAEDVRPGVRELVAECRRHNVPIATASSSPPDWVDPLLETHGLLEAFPVRCNAGDGVAGKPDPAVYLLACERLGVDPRTAVALEDSPNGVRAAKGAGMTCVAVETSVSRHLDLSHADRVVSSLLALRT